MVRCSDIIIRDQSCATIEEAGLYSVSVFLGTEHEHQRRASRDECRHKNQGSGRVTLIQDVCYPGRLEAREHRILSLRVRPRRGPQSSLCHLELSRLFVDLVQGQKTLRFLHEEIFLP